MTTFLEHSGPIFPKPYQPLPQSVFFCYNGEAIKLSLYAEEVATLYARMSRKYTKKKIFRENFFQDWRETMTEDEKSLIQNMDQCDFSFVRKYFKKKSVREETEKLGKKSMKMVEEKYGFCVLRCEKTKIQGYKFEAASLFRGGRKNKKSGRLRQAFKPEDVTINCGENCVIPTPPDGHQWKNVIHNSHYSWLAKVTDSLLNHDRYVVPSSKKINQDEDKKKQSLLSQIRKMKQQGVKKKINFDSASWKAFRLSEIHNTSYILANLLHLFKYKKRTYKKHRKQRYHKILKYPLTLSYKMQKKPRSKWKETILTCWKTYSRECRRKRLNKNWRLEVWSSQYVLLENYKIIQYKSFKEMTKKPAKLFYEYDVKTKKQNKKLNKQRNKIKKKEEQNKKPSKQTNKKKQEHNKGSEQDNKAQITNVRERKPKNKNRNKHIPKVRKMTNNIITEMRRNTGTHKEPANCDNVEQSTCWRVFSVRHELHKNSSSAANN